MEEHYLNNFRIFDQESNMKEIHTTEQDYCEFCSEVFDVPTTMYQVMWHFLDVKDKIYDDSTINSLGLHSSSNATTTNEDMVVSETSSANTSTAASSTESEINGDDMIDIGSVAKKEEQSETLPESKEAEVEYIVVDAKEEEIEILEEYQEPVSDSGEDSKADTMYYFKCSFCENIYGNKKDLNAHQIAEHMHKCQTCGITLKDDKSLQEHAKTHKDTKLFMCGVCKVILEKRYLQQHMKKHVFQQQVSSYPFTLALSSLYLLLFTWNIGQRKLHVHHL